MVVKKKERLSKVVVYYRVSTDRQGRSGLGLEAQKASAIAFCLHRGLTICKEYVEVESGKVKNRPQLEEAIGHAKACHCLLLIAKLDRLARNAAFTLTLLDSGLDIAAADMPDVDRAWLQMAAVWAEKEGKDISDRTTAALQAYKARGGKLGSQRPECKDNLSDKARRKGQIAGGKAKREKADEAYAILYPIVLKLKADGKKLQEIANELNEAGFCTAKQKPFGPVQVLRLIKRAERLQQ